ncbi:MAG TPA: LysR family transcriptional regulator [Rhizomicrobium sp.]|nr:LysR family transcriptional regulator [Rhizomicrobium sp.]
MPLSEISLNPLRAFEAAARHLSFTRAAEELCVTQAAVSHQVKALEAHLGAALFRRTTRGLVLTDEGAVLRPVVEDAFGRIERVMGALAGGAPREVLTVGVVGTFAIGFLIERLADFRAQHPFVDLRLLTNNNKVDLWTESLDFAIRFGAGAWHGVQADPLLRAPITALCSPAIAQHLRHPADLEKHTLLRSYRGQDWPAWLAAAGVPQLSARGPVFDASPLMVQAAILGEGVALAPASMFQRDLNLGTLVQPFAVEVDVGGYWLTRLISKPPTRAMEAFQTWLAAACRQSAS